MKEWENSLYQNPTLQCCDHNIVAVLKIGNSGTAISEPS